LISQARTTLQRYLTLTSTSTGWEQSNEARQKRRRQSDREERDQPKPEDDPLKDATTIYVGNLSFYTTEEQIHELFSKYDSILCQAYGPS